MTNISTPRSRRSGFTLIEVAIALAIFVFGALAIVQIFPPALGVIRNNEGRVAATQLGETMLARTAGKPESVPDAIYDGDVTGAWQDTPAAVVGTPNRNNSLPANPLPVGFAASALGRFKYVEGERHTVRTESGGTEQWVMLNYPATAGSTIWVDQEENISGVQIDEDGVLDFRYATDSQGAPFTTTNTAVGWEKNPPQNKTSDDGVLYYVSYKWVDGGDMNGVIDEPILVPEGVWTGTDGKVAVGVMHTDDRIIPGSVKVRYRQRLGSTVLADPAASSGYYLTRTGSVSQVLDASSNPVNLVSGKTYRFSYSVSDWRWLVDDGNVPTASGRVQLPVKNLDEQPVWGVQSIIGDANAPALLTPALTRDESKNGTIPYAGGSGLRYRTVYRALDGWSQQLSVAAKSYVPFYQDTDFGGTRPTALPREPWREYYWPSGSTRLFFHPSEAGKSVSISYVDTAGNRVNGVVLTIDNIEASAVPPAGFFGTYDDNGTSLTNDKVAYTTITNPAGNPATNVAAILSVQGLSIQARTAWQNADRYNQVIVPSYRTLLQ